MNPDLLKLNRKLRHYQANALRGWFWPMPKPTIRNELNCGISLHYAQPTEFRLSESRKCRLHFDWLVRTFEIAWNFQFTSVNQYMILNNLIKDRSASFWKRLKDIVRNFIPTNGAIQQIFSDRFIVPFNVFILFGMNFNSTIEQ